MKTKDTPVGGQAVIEGVMMRKGNQVAIAVRKKKAIKVKKEKVKSLSEKYRFLKWPFFRGIINLYEMLVIGINALNYSAEESVEGHGGKITKSELFFTILFAILLTVLLFVALPLFLTKLLVKNSGIFFNFIDGIIRIVIFILYIYMISLLKDIKRIFEYHGAEHKAVNCYEAKEKLTVKNCKKHPKAHLRCGTSFLVIVLIISILVFSLVTSPSFLVKLLSRIILIPVIIGVSYELLKLFYKYKNNPLIRILAMPGLWVQGLTTKEPDDKQLEVAIASLNGVVKNHQSKTGGM